MGKSNFKRYFRIERDGSVTEKVFLHVPDIRLREEIICRHFLSFTTKHFLREITGVKLISRDDPWDFNLELSNDSKFHLEIVSIADNKWLYEKTKREEILEEARTKHKIPLRNLIKYSLWLNDPSIQDLADQFKSEGFGKDDMVDNPFYGENVITYLSHSGVEPDNVAKLIEEAIISKQNKPHEGKENTVLIIDNRTSCFETDDIQNAMGVLDDVIHNTPFSELYIYTGYYSDNDGNNAEYSFLPLKIPEDKSLS